MTVNRPDKLNACLNREIMHALNQAFLEAAASDDEVRAAILTGAGPKASGASVDIAEMGDLSAMQGRKFCLLN
ncbi:3-hydroxybutyryl-CoA dehydratase [Xanthomonas fragariae]|uniref:3-hydroxybutyryl-CoA dehydratase n=1 Tax=Xanthomonas fragariae TaxID=48664 RepID=A0A1Y6GW02_9XANT|nr:3-hydroxybutyryl-CoA dehydratase [Xanthomonas fragariae]SMQ98992.1 3-hydroxybutyryl-CoA dehydratase [Xanthomonas fragariae]SMR03034.1 3-hydroxybutyryl-CoA dehydratase [Xanthomonas fragariae]